MVQDNFSFQLDDQSYQTKKRSVNIYFKDKLEKLLESDWQNKECKYRYTKLTEKDRKNIIV